MLSRLLKEHQAKQNERKEQQGEWPASCLAIMLADAKNRDDTVCQQATIVPMSDVFTFTERRRREAIAAATCLTEALVDHLNVG